MSSCMKCGKSAGIPSSIPMKDMRTGTMRSVQTGADLAMAMAKPKLKDQRGMNQTKLNVKNPVRG